MTQIYRSGDSVVFYNTVNDHESIFPANEIAISAKVGSDIVLLTINEKDTRELIYSDIVDAGNVPYGVDAVSTALALTSQVHFLGGGGGGGVAQTLAYNPTTNILSISGGNSVDLSDLQDAAGKYPYDEIEITPEGGSHQIIEGDNPYLFVYEATETYGNPEASVFLPDTSGWTSDNDGCFFEIKNWSYTKSININAFGASFGYPLRAEHSVRMIWTLANGWYEYDYNKEFAWSSDESSNPRDGMNLRRTGDVLIGSLTKNKVSKLEVNGDITGDSYNHTNITRFTGTGVTLDDSSTSVLYFNPTIPGANVNLTDPSTWTTRDTTDAYFWIYNDSSTNGFDILDRGTNLIFLFPGESVIVRWDNVDWRAWSKTSAKDADWLVPLSTIPPSNITDNMFTQGNVAIGEDKVADANLEVSTDVLASGYRWKQINTASFTGTYILGTNHSALATENQVQVLTALDAVSEVTIPKDNSPDSLGAAYYIKNAGTNAFGVRTNISDQIFTPLAGGESALYVNNGVDGSWVEYFRSTGGGGGGGMDPLPLNNIYLGDAGSNPVATPTIQLVKGQATLVAGTVTISDVNITTSSVVTVTPTTTGTLTGILKVGAPSVGSVTITSTVGTDDVTFNYHIL